MVGLVRALVLRRPSQLGLAAALVVPVVLSGCLSCVVPRGLVLRRRRWLLAVLRTGECKVVKVGGMLYGGVCSKNAPLGHNESGRLKEGFPCLQGAGALKGFNSDVKSGESVCSSHLPAAKRSEAHFAAHAYPHDR